MADALSLGVTYSSVKGRVLPSPMEHAPSSLLAALFFHSPCAAFAVPHPDKACSCHQRRPLQGTVMLVANKCLRHRPGRAILRGDPTLNHEEERVDQQSDQPHR
jgi:hypothetical protein